jgi:hypothetical protein
MTFICGGGHVAKPLTSVQLMRICSFAEEFFLANPTLFFLLPSKFLKNLKSLRAEGWKLKAGC